MATVLGGLAVALALVLLLGYRNERYFAGTPLGSAQKSFLGDSLAAMDEPVLTDKGHSADYRALRVLYLPTWGRPVALRYEGEGPVIQRRAIGLEHAGASDANEREPEHGDQPGLRDEDCAPRSVAPSSPTLPEQVVSIDGI